MFKILLLASVIPSMVFSENFSNGLGGRITHVYDNGFLGINGRGGYRLWGVDPNVEYLREITSEQDIYCRINGDVKKGNFSTTLVTCHFFDTTHPLAKVTISRHLIETGNGEELCMET